jgi:phosphonate transport system substrate-binding protein
MRPLLKVLVLAVGMLAGVRAWAVEPFLIGVAPHTSARVLIEQYQPLRLHLERALGQPVAIVTAPDFTEFARRALHGQYDLIITTGHQARQLQTDAGALPLLTYQATFAALAVVVAEGPVRTEKDLSGKAVLGLSPSSLVTLWGMQWLQDAGVEKISMRFISAADSLVQAILRGEAAAGFISQANYDNLSPDVARRLRILARSQPLAGRIYLLDQRHAARRAQIEDALWAFARTPAARAYFERTHLGGYRRLEEGELERMEPYAERVRQILKGSG